MLTLSVYSPERKFIENVAVSEVSLYGSEGQIQILPGHADIVGILTSGAFSFTRVGADKSTGFISSGFFELTDGKLSIMAETLELDSEIDLDRARTAQRRAEEALSSQSIELDQIEKYQLKLQRALLRQQIAQQLTQKH